MHKLLTFCFIIMLSFGSVMANKTFLLSGEVVGANNVPIPQAVVAIGGTQVGTYADENGNYSFKITPGKHTITVSAYGFKLQQKNIEITNDKQLNFTLEKQAIDLSTVHVYSKSKNQQRREGSFTVNSLDIRHKANSLNELSTSLGRSSGILVRENGGVGADFDLSINGLSGNSIRYFIDGVPLSSMGNGVSIVNLPVNIVDHIEVFKGVVPAYLGSDALGGAVNIITKKGVQNFIDASYGLGSFGTQKADFNAQYVNKKSKLFVRPSIGINYSNNNYTMKGVEVWNSETSDFENTDLERFHDDYFSLLAQLKVGIADQKWADLFSLSTSYFTCDDQMQTGSVQSVVYGMATRESQSYNISGEYQKNEFFIKDLSANVSLSHTWDYRMVVDTAYRKYRWDGSYIESSRSEILGRSKSIRHIERPLTIGRTNFNYTINHKHGLNFNYLLRYLTNDRYDDFDQEFEPSKDKFNKHILGLSYNQSLWQDKLINTFFVKDYISHLQIEQQDLSWITGSDEIANSSTTNNWGYGLSSRLRIAEQLAIKASYEHSVRLPSAREHLGNGTTVYPNFRLMPENSNNINLGLFGNFQFASVHRLFYETNVFYRNVEDYVRLVITESEGVSQYGNVKNVTVQGVEGELRYDYKSLFQVIANFSYLDERNKTKYQANGKPSIAYNNRMPNRPWLYNNIEFNIRKKDVFGLKNSQLRLAYNFQYVHWFYLTWEGYGTLSSKSTIPSQYSNNLQVTYSLQNQKYNISLDCRNILDRTLYDNYMMQKPGRAFFLKLRVFIN